jgi:3'-phosphoadenosine 5'-phosphosulfate sulfotransferase (PAPS reductase)/FAD synthetase
MRHLVAVSGGKDSTALALRLAEVEPRDYEFCITPTGRELPEMIAHWQKLECLLGKALTKVPGPSLVESIKRNNALPNWRMRFCTRETKIEPFMAFAKSAAPAVCYVGIRADEVQGDDARQGTDWNGVEGVTQDLPLVRWGWGINRVKEFLRQREVVVPLRTDCDICFYQRMGEWWRLWRDHKDRWTEGEALEQWSGHTF